MLVEALAYFRRGENGERAFLTGAILSFSVAILLQFGVLVTTLLAVVPAVALAGYFAQVLVSSADGETAPPAISFSAQLFRDGLLAVIVAGLYLLVPAAILLLTVGGALSAGVNNPQTFPTSTGIYAGSIVALVTAFAFAYLAPAATLVALQHESLRAGFAFAEIKSVVGHVAYLSAWVLALGLIAIGVFAATWLAEIPTIGPAFAVFVGFYALATATHLLGQGCT